MSAPRAAHIPSVWARLIALGFRLLYNELAWLYDPVSWLVSLGRWRTWQRSALPFLPPGGRVLEVGFGPGHMLAALAGAGYSPFGLDSSPAMLRLARRRLRRAGLAAGLARGRAERLPFAANSFDAVLLTFPTPFVYGAAWLDQLARVLRPAGTLVVVESAVFTRRDPASRGVEWLYRVTGQRGTPPDLPALLAGAGLAARREHVQLSGSRVELVVARRPA
jgi:ubiquinone/menaquinone biosynthesis C-methylase UbiE